MLISKSKKTGIQKGKANLKAGEYESVVISIGFHPDFDDEEALLVKYVLTDEDGNEFNFSEVFYNVAYNQRTQNFYEYLVANGISLDEYTTFEGCKEQLTLKKVIKNNVPLLSIVDRKFVAKAGDTYAI